jgi:hypothetical protein
MRLHLRVPATVVLTALRAMQVNILTYMARLSSKWTHLLKTDDDCYVRLQHVIRSVQVCTTNAAFPPPIQACHDHAHIMTMN